MDKAGWRNAAQESRARAVPIDCILWLTMTGTSSLRHSADVPLSSHRPEAVAPDIAGLDRQSLLLLVHGSLPGVLPNTCG